MIPIRDNALETLQRVADQEQAVTPSRRSRTMKRAVPSIEIGFNGEERDERSDSSPETAEDAPTRPQSSLHMATPRPAVSSTGHDAESAESADPASNSSGGYLSETQGRLSGNPSSSRSLHSRSSSSNMPSKPPSSDLLLPRFPQIANIDPSLAAAELASTLTTHVCCSVCTAKGVNFPECRKCGMRFCSRGCRVGVAGGGDGKRSVPVARCSIARGARLGVSCPRVNYGRFGVGWGQRRDEIGWQGWTCADG